MLILQIILGFAIGLIAGLIGIGGGAMFVPLFIWMFQMSIHQAVGTSIAVIAPIAIVGSVSHFSKGNVEFAPVVLIAICAMAGMWVSGQVIGYIPPVILRKGVAVFLLLISIKLFLK